MEKQASVQPQAITSARCSGSNAVMNLPPRQHPTQLNSGSTRSRRGKALCAHLVEDFDNLLLRLRERLRGHGGPRRLRGAAARPARQESMLVGLLGSSACWAQVERCATGDGRRAVEKTGKSGAGPAGGGTSASERRSSASALPP